MGCQHCKQTNNSKRMRSNFLQCLYHCFLIIYLISHFFSPNLPLLWKKGAFNCILTCLKLQPLRMNVWKQKQGQEETWKPIRLHGNLTAVMAIVATSAACALAQLHCSVWVLCPPGDEEQRCCGLKRWFAALIIDWHNCLTRPAEMQGVTHSRICACSPPLLCLSQL